jgi:HEAT repeat protein
MDAFLARHAVSWRIACSCWEKKEKKLSPGVRELLEHIRPELDDVYGHIQSQREIGGKRIDIAFSPHYIIVTDIPWVKIATIQGPPRIASKHEFMQLMLMRAEMARRDFEGVFESAHNGRSVMVMMRSQSTQRKFSQHYFGRANTNVLYGYGSGKTIMEGSAGNGFCISGKNDDNLHFQARHLIGHLLMSCYRGVNPHEKNLPRWVTKGCAHWLCKLHPRAEDFATFCQDEGASGGGGGGMGRPSTGGGGFGPGGLGGGFGGAGAAGGSTGSGGVGGSGANWDTKARKIARKGPRKDPVEAMFQAATHKTFKFDMHVRAWSWFDIFIEEERQPFVDFIRRLRSAQEARVAAKAAWGQAPEIVDRRWRDRVLGKRRDVEASDKELDREKDVGEANTDELADIGREPDMQLLAGRIRGLESCQNVATARLLISLMDSRDSDRVREVIAIVLNRTDDEEILAYLRGEGYKRAGKLGRATICRMLGELKDEEATPLLRAALEDSFWLVKANACRALAQIGDAESIPTFGKMAVRSTTGKVKVAAMDALGAFGNEAAEQVPVFERNIMHRNWQVKVATCQAFRAINSDHPVDILIGRLDSEGGRVHDEIKDALKDLTGVDKDWRAQTWLKWWAKAKKIRGLEKKMREELGEEEEEEKDVGGVRSDDRYARQKRPTYYGIKVYARTVGYVLDISDSMKQGFRVSAGWEDRLGHKFEATTRIGVSKEELIHSIKTLDPRTRFSIVFFNDRVKVWQTSPVAAGASADAGVSAVKNIQPKGTTNYYDALRVILGMEGTGGGWRPAFADTPDTLFFLTDGAPTDGEITKADELLAWFNERNRFARLRVHVIAMGTTGVDLGFLRKLAQTNGGKFVHLTGTY